MGLRNPPHPGRSIRRDCLEALGLSVTEGAKVLGITRHMLSRIINGQAGISPEMAVRLEKAFGGTATSWLALQQAYDLAQVERACEALKAVPGVLLPGEPEQIARRERAANGIPIAEATWESLCELADSLGIALA